VVADKPILGRLRFKGQRREQRFILGAPSRPAKSRTASKLTPGFNPRRRFSLGAGRLRRSPRTAARRRPSWRRPFCSTSAPGLQLHARPGRDYGRTASRVLARPQGRVCEHFRAAFVVVMRAAGVRREIVTGYGQQNCTGGSTATDLVRQQSAMPGPSSGKRGTGWVATDRTGAGRPRPDRPHATGSHHKHGFVAGTIDAINPTAVRRIAQPAGSGQQPLEPRDPNYSRARARTCSSQDRLRRATWEGPRPSARRDVERLAPGRVGSWALARPVHSRRPRVRPSASAWSGHCAASSAF